MLPFQRRILLLGFALAPLGLIAGCEKQPLFAPTGSSITLTATTNTLSANGSTPIIAQVLEPSGFPPHSGTQITFVTTLGQIQPSEANTDVNGQVTATFLAGGQNGTATITAISGGSNTGTSGGLKILVGTAAVGRVTVTANPLSVPASGGSSTIGALVVDVNGNPLSGSQVAFTTTAGTLSQNLVNTDSSGIASTVLSTTATATVTASVGATAPTPPSTTPPTTPTAPSAPSATGQASGTVTVTVTPAPTVTITTPTTVQKNIPATFTVVVTAAASGGVAIRDVTLNWGDGTSTALGSFTGSQAATHTYASTGPFVVTANVTDVAGNIGRASAPISVVSVAGTAVVVNTTTPSAPANTAITFTVTITPPTGVGIVTSSIDYGDGQVDQLGAAGAATKTHTYTTSGQKNVVVTVVDTLGRTSVGTLVVTIS
jgi:Big-like domain-containing protein